MNALAELRKTPLAIAASYLDNAPVNLEGMASDLGLSVDMDAPMQPDFSGRIVRSPDSVSGYHVDLNSGHSRVRRRFTLAHEIGHPILHRELIGDGVTDDALYRSKLTNAIETEANRFAAQLLMPAALVRRIFKAGLRHISGLSKAFDVSEEAMRIRLTIRAWRLTARCRYKQKATPGRAFISSPWLCLPALVPRVRAREIWRCQPGCFQLLYQRLL